MKKITYFILLVLSLSALLGCQQAATPQANCILKSKSYINDGGYLKITGEIENAGNARANNVIIAFTLKSSSEAILETPSCYVSTRNIDAGATAGFTCYTSTGIWLVHTVSYDITWE